MTHGVAGIYNIQLAFFLLLCVLFAWLLIAIVTYAE